MARIRRNANRGATGLPTRGSTQDPMEAFDKLPPELRKWIGQAKMPWSPRSCLSTWRKARAGGLDIQQTLAQLDRNETATLEKARIRPNS